MELNVKDPNKFIKDNFTKIIKSKELCNIFFDKYLQFLDYKIWMIQFGPIFIARLTNDQLSNLIRINIREVIMHYLFSNYAISDTLFDIVDIKVDLKKDERKKYRYICHKKINDNLYEIKYYGKGIKYDNSCKCQLLIE